MSVRLWIDSEHPADEHVMLEAGSMLRLWRLGERRCQSIRWMDRHPRHWGRVTGGEVGLTHAEALRQTAAPPRPGVPGDADIVEGVYDSEIAIPELEGTNEQRHESTLVL